MSDALKIIETRHANFVKYSRETLAEMNVEVDHTAKEFLEKSAVDMLRILKVLLVAMPKDAVESMVVNKLGVQRSAIPPERLAKLLRYSQYFCEVCRTI